MSSENPVGLAADQEFIHNLETWPIFYHIIKLTKDNLTFHNFAFLTWK